MKQTDSQYERLRSIVQSFPNITVAVLADLVADQFIYGEISRVSREAPVLILKHRESAIMPGGGGNAIMNLADLKVNVLPVGVVGDDEPGRLLLQAFRAKKISLSGVNRLKGYTTPTKTRILAGMPHSSRQQVVRVDREPEPLDESRSRLRSAMLASLLPAINSSARSAVDLPARILSTSGFSAPRFSTMNASDPASLTRSRSAEIGAGARS